MLQASASVRTNKDAVSAVDAGTRAALLDAATHGFDESQRLVAEQSTDTGHLLQSGVPPQQLDDGTVVWGYNADYAEDVEQGQDPHWIENIEPLLGWARRVLGDEQAAYPVRRKIAEEGTDPQPFVRPGIDAMRARLRAKGIGAFIEANL